MKDSIRKSLSVIGIVLVAASAASSVGVHEQLVELGLTKSDYSIEIHRSMIGISVTVIMAFLYATIFSTKDVTSPEETVPLSTTLLAVSTGLYCIICMSLLIRFGTSMTSLLQNSVLPELTLSIGILGIAFLIAPNVSVISEKLAENFK